MATKISKFYRQAAIERMSLNITDDSMFVLLPSEYEDDTYYRVDLDEQTLAPKKCCCRGFCRSGKCKHFTITAEAFAGYKPAPVAPEPVEDVEPVEPKITEIEFNNFYVVNSNTQVWRTEAGEWMAVGPTTNAVEIFESHLEKQKAVKEAERLVTEPVVAQQEEKSSSQEVVSLDDKRRERDILDAPLTRNSGFSLLKVS